MNLVSPSSIVSVSLDAESNISGFSETEGLAVVESLKSSKLILVLLD